MPVIKGQSFPPYVYREYPKVVNGRLAENAAEAAMISAHLATCGVFRDHDCDCGQPEQFNGADPSKFDHDGNGKPGGSKKGRRRRNG